MHVGTRPSRIQDYMHIPTWLGDNEVGVHIEQRVRTCHGSTCMGCGQMDTNNLKQWATHLRRWESFGYNDLEMHVQNTCILSVPQKELMWMPSTLTNSSFFYTLCMNRVQGCLSSPWLWRGREGGRVLKRLPSHMRLRDQYWNTRGEPA